MAVNVAWTIKKTNIWAAQGCVSVDVHTGCLSAATAESLSVFKVWFEVTAENSTRNWNVSGTMPQYSPQ